jgi:hypothetical protein
MTTDHIIIATEQGISFAYAMLDSETRIVVQQKTSEIRERVETMQRSTIEIGQRLREVKARLRHGQWGDWLASEFRWSDQTALNMINVAELADQTPKILEFEDRFAKSALTALAAPNTPPEARQEALALAERGEKVSSAMAQQLIADHKPPPAADGTPHLPPDFARAQARAKKIGVYLAMSTNGRFTLVYESTRAVAGAAGTWPQLLDLLAALEQQAAAPPPKQTALPGVADDQEIAAAAPALTPLPPPMLTPLTPVAPAASDDSALIQKAAMLLYCRKLAAQAQQQWDATIRPYLDQDRLPIVTLDEAQAEAAARMALASPALRAQASMLTFGATVSWDEDAGADVDGDEEIVA